MANSFCAMIGRCAGKHRKHSRPYQPSAPNGTQVAVVARTLIGVALVAERLKVREVVGAPVPSRQDVIDLQRSLLG